MGVPLYVLEDKLFRVANWEDQTKEDLASNFYVKGTKHLPLGLMMISDLAARYKYSLKGTLKGTQQGQN